MHRNIVGRDDYKNNRQNISSRGRLREVPLKMSATFCLKEFISILILLQKNVFVEDRIWLLKFQKIDTVYHDVTNNK